MNKLNFLKFAATLSVCSFVAGAATDTYLMLDQGAPLQFMASRDSLDRLREAAANDSFMCKPALSDICDQVASVVTGDTTIEVTSHCGPCLANAVVKEAVNEAVGEALGQVAAVAKIDPVEVSIFPCACVKVKSLLPVPEDCCHAKSGLNPWVLGIGGGLIGAVVTAGAGYFILKHFGWLNFDSGDAKEDEASTPVVS
ncbi:MAG: hypothetical protein LBJ77_00910 [Holosporales bacterium]|jgi:hypothetical protein|nr:hypothetical protein [Holosporales bacterium]